MNLKELKIVNLIVKYGLFTGKDCKICASA